MSNLFLSDLKTIPNILSVGRVFLVIITLLLANFTDQLVLTLILGITAGVTDFFDGYLARKLNQETALGAVLDQYSDLVYEGLFFLLLVSLPDGLSPLFLGAYLAREFWVMSMRRMMAERGLSCQSSMTAKLKTHGISYGFIAYWVAYADLFPAHSKTIHDVGIGLFLIGLALSYISGFNYTRDFMRGYNETEAKRRAEELANSTEHVD